MEVILQQDLDELGLEGDIVKVAKGYARNYLIPKGIALEAISQNIKVLEQRRKKRFGLRLSVSAGFRFSLNFLKSTHWSNSPTKANSIRKSCCIIIKK